MCFLIDWIALIGRDPNPVRNPVYRSKSMKNPSCTRTLPGPVRPCWTGYSALTGQTDRLVPILAVNWIIGKKESLPSRGRWAFDLTPIVPCSSCFVVGFFISLLLFLVRREEPWARAELRPWCDGL